MGKDVRLVNIYLKIHNKRTLTMDDLSYLAKYAPECFEKTCKNVVYNIPETKPIMEPADSKSQTVEQKEVSSEQQIPVLEQQTVSSEQQETTSEQQNIEQILENLKRLEADEFPVENVDVDEVKNLLGNLYMELLFPHNDKDSFLNVKNRENTSLFDKKA